MLLAALAAVAAVAGLAGCGSSAHLAHGTTTTMVAPSPSPSPSTTTGSTAGSASPGGGTGTGSSTAPTTAPESTAAFVNEAAPPSVKSALLAAYASQVGLPPSEVIGPNPGSVYYAYVTGTSTYWAVASFGFTPAVYSAHPAIGQDGSSRAVFTLQPDSDWQAQIQGEPWPCTGDLPSGLLSLWGIQISSVCSVAGGQSPAFAQRGTMLTSLAPGTYFGNIIAFNLQQDGAAALQFEPETWTGSTPPTGSHGPWVELNISSATTTGYWVGTSRTASHEVQGTFGPTFGQLVQSDLTPFASQPYSGYEITVTTEAGCRGQPCEAAASIEQFDRVTPLPLDPHFVGPTS
jgi:hypothetical protein